MNYSYSCVCCVFVFAGDTICPVGMFKCPEGKCIPALWVCNYQKDCDKGEDEFQSCRKYYIFVIQFIILCILHMGTRAVVDHVLVVDIKINIFEDENLSENMQ